MSGNVLMEGGSRKMPAHDTRASHIIWARPPPSPTRLRFLSLPCPREYPPPSSPDVCSASVSISHALSPPSVHSRVVPLPLKVVRQFFGSACRAEVALLHLVFVFRGFKLEIV